MARIGSLQSLWIQIEMRDKADGRTCKVFRKRGSEDELTTVKLCDWIVEPSTLHCPSET